MQIFQIIRLLTCTSKKKIQIHGNYHAKSDIRMSMAMKMMATATLKIMASVVQKFYSSTKQRETLLNRRENNKLKHNRIE